MDNLGFISIVPATLAIALAFITRDAILSLAIASAIGLMLIGGSFLEFPSFLIDIMASDSFAWVFFIEILIGVLIALFQLSGVSDSFYL